MALSLKKAEDPTLAGTVRSNNSFSNSIISYSFGLGERVFITNIDSALQDPKYVIKKTEEHGQHGVFKVASINESDFAMITLNDTTRFSVVDRKAQIINKFMRYPFLDELAAYNPKIYGHIFQGALISSPKIERAAYFQYDSFNWHIIDFSDPLDPHIILKGSMAYTNLPTCQKLKGVTRNILSRHMTQTKKHS